jgi:hypothetical protein
MKLCRNFSQRTHPIHSIGPKTHVLGSFGPFCYLSKGDAKLAEPAPLTPKFDKRSCIGNFPQWLHPVHSIRPKTHVLWCFRPFCYCTKVEAKLAELVPKMHKFAKLSCVGIFHNEGTRSTPFDPTHDLGCLGPFCYCTKLDVKQPEHAPATLKFAKRSCVGTFRNEQTRSTPLDPKLMFWGVSDRFVAFRKSMQNWPN